MRYRIYVIAASAFIVGAIPGAAADLGPAIVDYEPPPPAPPAYVVPLPPRYIAPPAYVTPPPRIAAPLEERCASQWRCGPWGCGWQRVCAPGPAYGPAPYGEHPQPGGYYPPD
jgi:hypothetical protein